MSGERIAAPAGATGQVPRLAAAVVLLFFGGWAIVRWPDEMGGAETPLQRLTAVGVLAYGVTGVVAGVGVLRRRAWARGWAWGWAAALTLTGGLAPVSFGGASLAAGLAAGLATALAAAGVLWLVHRALRGRSASPHPEAGGDAASP